MICLLIQICIPKVKGQPEVRSTSGCRLYTLFVNGIVGSYPPYKDLSVKCSSLRMARNGNYVSLRPALVLCQPLFRARFVQCV